MAAGLTQEALAERAGLSVRGVQDLERGLKRAPRFDSVRLLADALGLAPGAAAALTTSAQRGPRGGPRTANPGSDTPQPRRRAPS